MAMNCTLAFSVTNITVNNGMELWSMYSLAAIFDPRPSSNWWLPYEINNSRLF